MTAMAQIRMANPVVEPAGSAVDRNMPGLVRSRLALPHLDPDRGYHDPGTGRREALASMR